MKRVLAVKTPVGGVVQIVPCEQNGAAVALSWRETLLTNAEKEASRLYLFDEGFIELAAGTHEPDLDIEQFLRGIPDIAIPWFRESKRLPLFLDSLCH